MGTSKNVGEKMKIRRIVLSAINEDGRYNDMEIRFRTEIYKDNGQREVFEMRHNMILDDVESYYDNIMHMLVKKMRDALIEGGRK